MIATPCAFPVARTTKPATSSAQSAARPRRPTAAQRAARRTPIRTDQGAKVWAEKQAKAEAQAAGPVVLSYNEARALLTQYRTDEDLSEHDRRVAVAWITERMQSWGITVKADDDARPEGASPRAGKKRGCRASREAGIPYTRF